jgi:hypothetical protein
MGLNLSKSPKKTVNVKINDYGKMIIPDNYKLLKMASYNISLSKSVSLDQKIKEIIHYIINKFKNKDLDIINLQEISDYSSLYIFMNQFKEYCLSQKYLYYFSPQYGNISSTFDDTLNKSSEPITTSENMIELSFNSSTSPATEPKKNKKIMRNLIISKYPIVSSISTELDDQTDMDDILGIQTFIGANILIGNSIISIYNTNLSKDIKAAQIINKDVRKTELNILLNTIDINKKSLNTDIKFKDYKKSGIHLVNGTFHIPEICDNQICDEYKELLSNNHFIDIFRILYEHGYGFTTTCKQRINYIFLHMTEDFYKIDSEYFNVINKKKDVKVLKSNLFKRYKIHFFDYYTVSQNDSISVYNPIECIFMVST